MAAPQITGLDGDSVTYQHGDGAVTLDQGASASASDGDFLAFNGGSLTISFLSGEVSEEDRIGIQDTGSGPGQIAAANGVVSFEGIQLGTYLGGASGDPLVVRLSGNANETAVAALVRAITYVNTGIEGATAGLRQLAVVATDAVGEQSNTAIVDVDVVSPPQISDLGGDIGVVRADGQPVMIDQGISAGLDSNVGDFGGATLTVSRLSGGAVTYSLASGVLSGGDAFFSDAEVVAVNGVAVATVQSSGVGGDDLVLEFVSGTSASQVETLLQALQASSTEAFPTITLAVGLQVPGLPDGLAVSVTLVSAESDALPVLVSGGPAAGFNATSVQSAVDKAGDYATIVVDGARYAQGTETVFLRGEATTLFMPASHALFLIMGQPGGLLQALNILGDGSISIAGNSLDNDIFGNAGSNVIAGYSGADTILGAEGDDRLFGHEGRDLIDGGEGNDTITGDEGDDQLGGGAGHDLIFGGTGNDLVYGGRGNDVLYGQEGDDTVVGETGDDVLSGGTGADLLNGGRQHRHRDRDGQRCERRSDDHLRCDVQRGREHDGGRDADGR
ncbi:calcium-binding protein [Tepidamorphus sp. 3E244]|uniref:calcium-binding protein n=1 Tax=Tepidamorphus sp. 3E244 TaxID=3385498 RepID=UPI0038FD3131